MQAYLETLREIYSAGYEREGRNGVTRSLFGIHFSHSIRRDGFPLLTTKKMQWDSIVAELCWFISGSRNVKDLQKMGCSIWDANAYDPKWVKDREHQFDGDVGRIYGVQWRDFSDCHHESWGQGVDQLARVINQIKVEPNSRRHIVTAWNPAELDQMCLPPCHMFYQFYVAGRYLSLQMYLRSGDMFLGVPFNIASYALLLIVVAKLTSLKPGDVSYCLGDAHIYMAHEEQVLKQLKRTPKELPTVSVSDSLLEIDQVVPAMFKLNDYQHYPGIRAEMIV